MMSWILILSTLLAGGGEIEWQKGNLPSAFTTARETGEPVMVYFRADWDRFSGQLEEGAFSDEEIVSLSEKFIRVLIDCSRKQVYRRMIEAYQLEGVPSVLFFDASGRRVGSVVGYVPDKDAYLNAMQEAVAKKNLLPRQDLEERMERIRQRVESTLSSALTRVREEIDRMVSHSLRQRKKSLGSGEDVPSRNGRGVTLGFSGRELPEETRKSLQMERGEGILVSRVPVAGAAGKAGIKAGDIVLSIDGKTVGPDTIREVLSTLSPEKELSVVLLRKGKRKVLVLIPEEKE